MFNLLPETYKKQVKSEYKIRRLGIFLAGLFFIQIIALASLFPSYVYSVLNHRDLSDALVSMKAADDFQSGEEMSEKIESINWQAGVLNSWGHNTFTSDFIEIILEQEAEGVQIKSIIFSTEAERNFAITIAGEASTRENLISFANTLRGREEFQRVNIPVSDLAQGFDISFSLELSGEF